METMTNDLDQALTNALVVKDRDGRIAVMVGLVITVFFENPWTREVREAVTDVAEDYIHQFRERLRWGHHPATAHMHSIESGQVRFPREWLPDNKEGETWEFAFHGGETEAAVSGFEVRACGAQFYGSTARNNLGDLSVSVPLLWFAEHPGSLQELALRICKRIKPASGCGGLGILESPNLMARIPFHPAVYKIAKRFPGLDLDSGGLSCFLDEGIKGANWLTILGDRWVDELGGLDALRSSLDPSFIFYPYEGGLMIQAGARPQAGDAEADRWPQHYVKLAKLLKKIQVKTVPGFHYSPSPDCMKPAESKAWITRFDGK